MTNRNINRHVVLAMAQIMAGKQIDTRRAIEPKPETPKRPPIPYTRHQPKRKTRRERKG